MPGYNQTGPWGNGPITGRGMGGCQANQPFYRTDMPGGPMLGRGRGLGPGIRCGFQRGRGCFPGKETGFRQAFTPPPYPKDRHFEIERMKARARSLQHALDETNTYLAEMEKDR